jgi:hypothetical protein
MNPRRSSREVPMKAAPGAAVLTVTLLYIVALVVGAVRLPEPSVAFVILLVVSVLAIVLAFRGLFIVNPNDAKVFVLFGKYHGTLRESGFFWANPFAVRHTISLKANNLASQVIKVNDLSGNPIEIAAVVVWQVRDTSQAMFDVEDFRHYVDVQIETAVRQLASAHPYDDDQAESNIPSLRGDNDTVNATLQTQLQSRLDRAGIEVIEARLSHLAYAPEIASAMLQRQQASAIIAARQKIVEGAVSMVEQALTDLGRTGVVQLDDERRATLVGNLLVVLCGHTDAQPVINTGSLYN